MAMRNCKTALLHVAYIAGAIWIGAHELALHNITDSDVYKGPTESLIAYPLKPPVVPSIESIQQSTSTSSIFDAPTFTTTEYVTVTRDDGPTPIPHIHRELSSRNPYANSTFVLGAIPYFVPFFESSYGQTLIHTLSWFSSHPVTKAVYQATTSLISFLLYLWSILPGGKQGLNTLALALFLYALQFAYFWDPLARWLSSLFRRRRNGSPSSHNSDPSPPPSPPSGGRPGKDDDDSPSDDPKPPKDTSSTGTQTTAHNTKSAQTQTTDLVTEGEQNCLNKLARLRGELAQANARVKAREQTIKGFKNKVSRLDKELLENNKTAKLLRAQIGDVREERESTVQNLQREINRLQAQIDAARSDRQDESDKIKRLKEAHEVQIKELQRNHNKSLDQQGESSSGKAENANSAEERQRLEHQIRDLQGEAQSLRKILRQQQDKHTLEVDGAVARGYSQALGELEMTKSRLKQSEETNTDLQKKLKRSQGIFAPPTPQVTALKNENEVLRVELAAVKEALSKKEANGAAPEAQNNQEQALQNCNNKVEALESTNTGLVQQNEALLEREKAARQAEKKARTEAEALQGQVDSLQISLSQAGAGNEAAARLQQGVADMAQRLRDTEEALNTRANELQQDLSQATAAKDTAVRQQQEDPATAQRLRESEGQLQNQISRLEQDLLQARSTYDAAVGQLQQNNDAAVAEAKETLDKLTSALEEANGENKRLRHALSEAQEKNEKILELGRQLETSHNQYADLNRKHEIGGSALQHDYDALKQDYAKQVQNCAAEKKLLEEQAQKKIQYEKQNSEGLRKSVRDLQEKVRELEDTNSSLQNELEMKERANQNLVQANEDLADQDLLKQWNHMSAADANQNDNNNQSPSHDQQMEDTNTSQSRPKDQQMDDANPTTQQTPFSNLPILPPPHSDTASPVNSPTHSPGVCKIIAATGARSARSKSPKKDRTDDDTTPSASPMFSDRVMATPTSRLNSPLRQMFDIRPSGPTTPNVFDTVNNPTRSNSTNGILRNAPVLLPNLNGHSQNPSAPGTPFDPTLGGAAPPVAPDAANTPTKTRDQERAEYNAQQLQIRQDRQHEERQKEAARVHQEMLREELGNFEGEYEGDDPIDAEQASATDGNGDTDMAGASPSSLVVGSRKEHTYLRNMPDNENGRHDALYRRHNYRLPDTFDEHESPIYFSDFVPGSDAETSFLRFTMPANQDGRHDALYRGNNYKMPDDWDEFDNPVWY